MQELETLRFFPYKKLHKYPHMMGVDVPVWERFIDMHPDRYARVSYDVHVGTGISPIPGLDESIQRLATSLTQKRIDALGIAAGRIDVIEVKDIAGVSAPGQVLGYAKLLEKQFPSVKMPGLVLVCGNCSPDVDTVAAAIGVQIFRV